jgi:hypothetical protein
MANLEQPKVLVHVKIEYEDDTIRVEGTSVEESEQGQVVIYEGERVVGRFNKVERWWQEVIKGRTASARSEDVEAALE